jgi:glycerol-3-phosphate acyltransferase PlsY
MNVAIQVGRWAGALVLIMEAAKGVLTVLLARFWQLSDLLVCLAVLAALSGTRWSIWIHGGGRGNTLGVAALTVLSWPAVALGIGLWIAVRLATRNGFWATRIWVLTLPLTLGLTTLAWEFALLGAGMGLFYLSEHLPDTDDHTIIKQTWPSLWAFLTAPPRRSYALFQPKNSSELTEPLATDTNEGRSR